MTTTSIEDKARGVTEDIAAARSRNEKLERLVALGRASDCIEPAARTDDLLVPGCMARFWLRCGMREGLCEFQCASDSAVMQGVGALLCQLYSRELPQTVVGHRPEELLAKDLAPILTANRRSSIPRIHEIMRTFAEAHIRSR